MSRTRLVIWLLVLGTLAVYLPASHYGFTLYDDNQYVADNPMVQNGLTCAGIQWAFTTWHASNWHPLTWLSHMLDCQLLGLNAGPQHVVNILFHAANSALVFILLRQWFSLRPEAATRQVDPFWPAAAAAALFAWHPLHVESVAWISERKDVLSTFWALLSLLCYTAFVQRSEVRGQRTEDGGRRSGFWYLTAVLCFTCALLSKPMFVTLPFVMLLLDYWPLRRVQDSGFKVQSLVVEKIPFFLLSAGSCFVTVLAQSKAVVSLKYISVHYRLENAPIAFTGYLSKLFWPAGLTIYYPLAWLNWTAAVVPAAVVLLVLAGTWLSRKNYPYLLVGWLWFLGTLVPVIGLVQVGGAAMADRYTYFPSIGIFAALTLWIADLGRRFHLSRAVIAVPAVAVLAVLLWLTHVQLTCWRDDIALFSHALAVTTDNPTSRLNLGYAYQQAGKMEEAMSEFRAALKLEPDNVKAHNNLANLLDDTGHPEQALAEFEAALKTDPDYAPAHNNLGTLLVELGRFDDAMKHYSKAMALDPEDWHAPFLLGKALLKTGRDAEAIPYFRKALQLNPNSLDMLVYLAQVLASDEDPKVRDGQAAYLLAFKANALSGGMQPVMLDTLGMAFAEVGRFNDAKQAVQDAIDTTKRFNATNHLAAMQQRLELYQKNQPFRQAFTNAPVKTLPKE